MFTFFPPEDTYVYNPTHDWDRAQLLYADPQHFINAARLLDELLDGITLFPMGERVMLFAHVTPLLANRMAIWGSELDDIEHDADLQEEPDREPDDGRTGRYLNEVVPVVEYRNSESCNPQEVQP